MVRLAWIASALLIIVAAWAGLRYAERGLSSPVADPANAERGTAQEDIAGSPARGATDQRPSTAAGSLPSAAMQPPETMLAQVQDAEPDFAAPAEQDEKQGGAEQTPRSMIGSLREALSPFRDLFTGDQQESIPDLQKAEQTWLDIKRDARQAPTGRCASRPSARRISS